MLFPFLSGGRCWVNTPRASCKTMRSGVVKKENETHLRALKQRRRHTLIPIDMSVRESLSLENIGYTKTELENVGYTKTSSIVLSLLVYS